jgi:hypothetical protein
LPGRRRVQVAKVVSQLDRIEGKVPIARPDEVIIVDLNGLAEFLPLGDVPAVAL